MKINLTYNNKPLIEPKSLIAFCTEPPILQIQLETNEYNINIIKDIKQNFVTLHNSGALFYIETKDNVYFASANCFYVDLPQSFQFVIVLINDDESINENYKSLYLPFRINGFNK